MIARRFVLLALVLAAFAAVSVAAVDVDRGRVLYESNCYECHSPAAHIRPSHVAADFDDIRVWVRRWNQHLGLEWSEADVNDVAVFLNTSYYRYPCPSDVCTVVSRAR